jgi:hypothetical protein
MQIQILSSKKWLGFLAEQLRQVTSNIYAKVGSVTGWVDDFFGLTWYHRSLRYVRHRMLEAGLRKFGEASMRIPAYVEKWRDADFAVRFGRTAPGEVKCLVGAAADAGIPEDDLRLLVLNRDVRLEKGVVLVRNGWGIQLLSWLAYAVFGSNVLYLLCWTLVLNGQWHIKLLVLMVLACIYGFLWRGLSLYTTRPLAAARRNRDALERLGTSQRSAVIVNL